MENINNILKNFSFSQPESDLYLAALKLKKATISQIAQKAGMGRTVAYFHIKNLSKRNVLKQIKSGRKILISSVTPSEFAERLQENVGSFKSLVPQLESLSIVENEIPEIEILESGAAFEKIYNEVTNMPAGSTWKVMEDRRGAEAELKLLDNKYWNNFFTRMAERDIVTKAIFTKELLSDINKSITPKNYSILKKRKWNIRAISEDALPIKNLILLYNKKLSFMFPELSMTITIKHPALFHVIDTLFETIFSFAEAIENPWEHKSETDS
jgi:hypothetical protein